MHSLKWHKTMNMPVLAHLKLGPQGRMVIPAAIREAMALQPGDDLSLHLEGGRLFIESVEQAKTKLRARFAHLQGKRSLADELIADRRREAAREQRAMLRGKNRA